MITLSDVTELILREMRGKPAANMTIDENTRLDELGLSSLQIAEVAFTLEEDHGVELDPARAADASTIGDLIALVNEPTTSPIS